MKKKPKITLITLTCGNYSLDIDNTGYLYYNVAELIEGFLYHVGLEKKDFADKDVISDLITACATFKKEGAAIEAAAKLTAENAALSQRVTRQQTEYKSLQTYNERLRKQVEEWKEKYEYVVKHGHSSYINRNEIPKKPKS